MLPLPNPDVQVELGDRKTINAKARIAQGEEYDRLYEAQVAKVPVFDSNRKKTTRVIPVVVLERA